MDEVVLLSPGAVVEREACPVSTARTVSELAASTPRGWRTSPSRCSRCTGLRRAGPLAS